MNARIEKTAAPAGSDAAAAAPDATPGAPAEDARTDVQAHDDVTDDVTDEAADELTDEEIAAVLDAAEREEASRAASGIGAGAAAVVSAALGFAALTGTWTGKVAAEREALIGQIKTSQGGSAAQQISEIYGDAWHATALVNGVFAFLAVLTAVLVLALAHPGRPVWIRAVATAGAVLGGIGLLLSGAMYFDLLMGLPTTGS
ncbi:hypothetical protein [Streptomyces sp. NPDC053755]|uniref:hypothetical protein n=1 Tax=Streptomyces sp. NPDC053755 TaxID=3155815 RepID=UPI0034143C81